MFTNLFANNNNTNDSVIEITRPHECYVCESVGLTENDKFCPNCGFPQNGSQSAMKKFLIEKNKNRELIIKFRKRINLASSFLNVLCLPYVVMVFGSLVTRDFLGIVFPSVCILIYLGLARWSNPNPITAFSMGIIASLIMFIVSFILFEKEFGKWLLLELVAIPILINGIVKTGKLKVLKDKIAVFNKSKDFTICN